MHREGSRAERGPQRSGVGISESKLKATSQSRAGLIVALMDVGTIHIKERLALSVLGPVFYSHHIPLPNIPV